MNSFPQAPMMQPMMQQGMMQPMMPPMMMQNCGMMPMMQGGMQPGMQQPGMPAGMQQACPMPGADLPGTAATLPGAVPGGAAAAPSMPEGSTCGGSSSSATKASVQAKKKPKTDKDEKLTTVFVGGLRKSTSEDKVAAHFSKYGQVDNVDIKRLPDGTSRGFAFVKFVEVGSVEKVVEARSSHMIDNKWVAVRPHGGSAFNAAQNAEKDAQAKAVVKEDKRLPEPSDGTAEDFEEQWSEKYLTVAAQVGALQKDDPADSVSTTQAMNMLGQAAASNNPMPSMGSMNSMPHMAQGVAHMMPMMMANMGMGSNMGMMPMMMNPMMMGMMMNPMMMGMMNGMQPMSGAKPESPDSPSGGPAPRESSGSQRSAPY